MKALAAIDFACNDHDNGLFLGRALGATLGDIEIDPPVWNGYRFSENPTAIRIHRLQFEIVRSKAWVGNWCWNRYVLRRDEMKRLLMCMRRNGWRVTCGPARFYAWWNA